MVKSDALQRIATLVRKAYPDDHYYVKDIIELEHLFASMALPASDAAQEDFLSKLPQYESITDFHTALEAEHQSPSVVVYLYIPPDMASEAGLLVLTPRNNKPLLVHMLSLDEKGSDNRRKLAAFLEAIRTLSHYLLAATLYVNDEVLAKGTNQWVYGWEKSGWMTSKGSPVQNADLWKDILALKDFYARFTVKNTADTSSSSRHIAEYDKFKAALLEIA